MHRVLFTLFFLTMFLPAQIFGQETEPWKLTVEVEGNEDKNRLIELNLQDSSGTVSYLQDLVVQYIGRGYLAARTDSISHSSFSKSSFARIKLGKSYSWIAVKGDSKHADYLDEAGFKSGKFASKKIRPFEFEAEIQKLLDYSSNNGFPFAKFWLDSLLLEEDGLHAVLRVDPYKRIFYDSIRVAGSGKLNNAFLQRWLSIRQGGIYREEQVNGIKQKIGQLDFVRLKEDPRVYFYNNKVLIDMLVEDQKVNQFEGIIGVFPNAQNSGKLRLTGDLRLSLKNSFKRGEHIGLNWKSIQTGTQDLKLKLNYPFIFNTAFGPDLDFRLFYRDSSFLEIDGKYALQYLINGGNAINVFYQQRTYNVLSTDSLSNLADLDSRLYGISIKWSNLNSVVNPTNGIGFNLSAAIGKKRLDEIDELPPEAKNSTQALIEGSLNYYWSGDNRFVTGLSIQNRILVNDFLYQNELLRFGGFNTLRGFEEEVLLASAYSILMLEERYMLADRSYLSIFWNGARLSRNTVNENFDDWPMGFGAGMNFNLENGVFSLLYALGRQKDSPFQFRSAKVHLGFTYFL